MEEAGGACTLYLVPGGYHGFDLIERRTPIAREFHRARMAALAAAFTADRHLR
ncbi:hypothetical protein [Nocardia sp. NPDC057455]|uniref:hypothetical protein n=1 Tax=Nocardia sp. NPDC057455 TaxID=3346138 RepID=UPI003671CC1E